MRPNLCGQTYAAQLTRPILQEVNGTRSDPDLTDKARKKCLKNRKAVCIAISFGGREIHKCYFVVE